MAIGLLNHLWILPFMRRLHPAGDAQDERGSITARPERSAAKSKEARCICPTYCKKDFSIWRTTGRRQYWKTSHHVETRCSASLRTALLTTTLMMEATVSFAQTGALTQLAAPAGCLTGDETNINCTVGALLDGLFSVAISPNGKQVYGTTVSGDNSITALTRNARTGAVKQPGGKKKRCVSSDGNDGACTIDPVLSSVRQVAFSPDGKYAYAISSDINVLAGFRRAGSGQLTPLTGTTSCVSEDGSGGACADGRGLEEAFSLVVSPDGKHVYVASLLGNAVAAFSRDLKTGALGQLNDAQGCVNEDGSDGCTDGLALEGPRTLAISPDGKNVYVVSRTSNAVVVFTRDAATGALTQIGCVSEDGSGGACADGKALVTARGVTVSADGKNVYVASAESDAVAVFARNLTTGALTQLAGTAGCLSLTGTSGACAVGRALDEAEGVAVSPDGATVYVAARASGAVAVFARDGNTGALSQLSGAAGCVNEDGSEACGLGVALNGARSVVVSPDGKHVYIGAANTFSVVVFTRQL